jgi:GT2 family glycosyltransferase
MNLVVVFPTFNRRSKVNTILNQLMSQDNIFNINIFIVVIIDGSTDGTFDLIKNIYPTVHTILGDGNLWYTKSMNLGFKYAEKFQPDYVLAINDDVEVDNNYISSLISDFNLINNQNCILGSISISNDQRQLIQFAGDYLVKKKSLNFKLYYDSLKIMYDKNIHFGIKESVTLPGRGILIPYKILLDLNFFDENLPQYGSDTDFCLRAINKHYQIAISWNAVIKANIGLTRVRSESNVQSYKIFFNDLFDVYSHYSLKKYFILEMKHGYKFLILIKLPLYIFQSLYSIYRFNKTSR